MPKILPKSFIKILLLFSIIAGISGITAPAQARKDDGSQWFLISPSSTNPAIAVAGDRITIDVAADVFNSCTCVFSAGLIVNSGRMALEASRVEQPDPRIVRFSARIPDILEPGVYDIAIKKSSNNDTAHRAVAVVPETSGALKIIHIDSPRISVDTSDIADPASAALLEIAQKTLEVKPDAVIITGETTATGAVEEYKNFLKIIDSFKVPTLVQSGGGATGNSEKYFGSGDYTIDFGDMALISFGRKNGETLSAPFPDDGPISKLRLLLNENKTAVCRIVFTDKIEGTAAQLAESLKPDRADIIITGGAGKPATDTSGSPPTAIVTTPPLSEGVFRIITIKNNAISEIKIENLH